MKWISDAFSASRFVPFVILGVGIAIGAALLFDLGGSPGQTDDLSSGRLLGGIRLAPCEEQQPGTIALLGKLTPGHSVGDIRSEGYGAVEAIDGVDSGLIVIFPAKHDPDIDRLKDDPALAVVSPLLAQATSDPDLRSCDYRLSDKPKAATIAAAASAAMIKAGVLTQEQIDSGGTIFLLSDDPTDPSRLLLTVSTAVGLETLPTAPLQLANLRTAYVAIVDRLSGNILDAGKGHWYDGQ